MPNHSNFQSSPTRHGHASGVHAPPTPDDGSLLQRLMYFLNPIDGRYEDLTRATGG